MLSLLCLLMCLNSVSCQPTVDDDMITFTTSSCPGYEFELQLRQLDTEQKVTRNLLEQLQSQLQNKSKQLADVTKQLELMQTANNQSMSQLEQRVVNTLELYTDLTNYYDIQFQVSPLIVSKSRQQLVAQLDALCNPLLIQQNVDGSDFFDRTWAEFKAGFNGSNGNYWFGNELLHQLTVTGRYKLRFDLQSRDNSQWYWAEYSWVTVHNESTGYELEFGEYTGNVYNDALTNSGQNRAKFTTTDRDNDRWDSNNCATRGGGFWYSNCGDCGVNTQTQLDYFYWMFLTKYYYDLRTSRMWLMCG
jgi:ficolin